MREENKNEGRTYLVYDKETDELVAYFTLKAGLVLKTAEISEGYVEPISSNKTFDAISGIELAYFGINAKYKEKHSAKQHYGLVVFADFIYLLAKEAAKLIGAPIIYGFSVDDGTLLEHYKTNYGFNKVKEIPHLYRWGLTCFRFRRGSSPF